MCVSASRELRTRLSLDLGRGAPGAGSAIEALSKSAYHVVGPPIMQPSPNLAGDSWGRKKPANSPGRE